MPLSSLVRSLLISMALPALAWTPTEAAESRIDTAKLVVSPTLAAELKKFKQVKMPFQASDLSSRERLLVAKLVEACRYLDTIYWQQSDREGYRLLSQLKGSSLARDAELRRFLLINGSRYDLIDHQKPFVGTAPRPPGADIFPSDLTKPEIDRYVALHPDQKNALYDPFTVVRREGETLKAIPYHVAFKEWLEPMSRLLKEAAALSDDAAFAKFLRLRADALLTDDYLESDVAWVTLVNPKFDVIFAPYETYLDDLLGVKTSYGAAVLIRNDTESRKLDSYQKYVPDIQDALPLAVEDRPSKKGKLSPMEVMDAPFRAGDLRHGYQAVADNLPNDPRIHEQHGSKKIFFKNYLDARVNSVVLPIAQRLLRKDQADLASADGYLTTTLMHEISHGLGPAFSRTSAGKKDIRESIGGEFSGLEEAKADIVGLYGLHWLADRGVVRKERLPEYYASFVAGIFRTVRFGVAEAHGRAQIMQFNYFAEHNAIRWEGSTHRYAVDFGQMPQAVASLAKELLEQEATGDSKRVNAWFAKYGAMPAELTSALKGTEDVPVDIDPIQDFPE
jgi:hypothetical protein